MAMPRRPHSDDLFEIFPDLPHMRHRTPEEQVAQVRRQVNATRERALLKGVEGETTVYRLR